MIASGTEFTEARLDRLDVPAYLRRRELIERSRRLVDQWNREEDEWLAGYLRKLNANRKRVEALEQQAENDRSDEK